MIELHVEPYCQNCDEFEADVDVQKLYSANCSQVETNIQCTHRGRCKVLYEHLKKETRDRREQ